MFRRDGYLPSEETLDHASETALRDVENIDYVLDNSGDNPQELYRAVDDSLIAFEHDSKKRDLRRNLSHTVQSCALR